MVTDFQTGMFINLIHYPGRLNESVFDQKPIGIVSKNVQLEGGNVRQLNTHEAYRMVGGQTEVLV